LGESIALAEFERFNDYLARGIVCIAYTLAPERVILGTIPSAAGEALCLEPVRRRVAERVWPKIARGFSIVPIGLGEDAPYRAALCAALEGVAASAR